MRCAFSGLEAIVSYRVRMPSSYYSKHIFKLPESAHRGQRRLMTILSMLFKGIPGDEHVYQSDFDGWGWSRPLLIPQIVSGSHPMWTRYYDQTLFTAWRGASAPHNVQAARYDGPNTWAWFGAVPGATSDAAPAGAPMFTSSQFL